MRTFPDREIAKALRRLAMRDGGSAGIGPELLDHLGSRGLIERSAAGAWGPTSTGAAWLRRRLAGADGYAAQHQARTKATIDEGDVGRGEVTVNQDESPLGWLRRHKGRDGRPLIDAVEFEAGERLRADYTRGQMMPRVTANWTATVAAGRRDGGAGGIAELTEAAMGARQRVTRALEAVGPEFYSLLIDVCCFLKGIEEVEDERGWPARSGKLVIRLALAALARHYGLSAVARGRSAGKIVHWGTEDYRPTIE